MLPFLRSKTFWIPFAITALVLSAFFAWELGYFGESLPKLPRMEATQWEVIFTVILIVLLALDVGLYRFRRKQGTCPAGTKRATGIAGALGAVALLCPMCLILPITILGVSFSLAILAPFLPLLRIIAIILLTVTTWMLWPKAGN